MLLSSTVVAWKFSNLMLSRKVDENIISIIYGANWCTLTKQEVGVRPIAVGCTFRRLTSKMACRWEFGHASEVVFPKQIGVAIKGGCESADHSGQTFLNKNYCSKKIMVKVDVSNAFNSLERDDLLNAESSPELYRFFYRAIHQDHWSLC